MGALRKSPNDPKEYDAFVLENGLEVLVISDPKTDVAAASLRVRVGNFSDPRDRQGLAHFLEHMLLISSKKYPEVDSYRKFIEQNGGRANASTGKEHTKYYFTIDQAYLEPALDRLSQFFIAPTFDPDLVERERNAVHAEFSQGLQREGRRSLEVKRTVANPAHPYSKFSVGNLETLADRDGDAVVDALRSFYESEYTASRMTLSVLGRQDVAELREFVQTAFSAIPTNGKAAPVLEEKRPPIYLEEQLGTHIDVKAISQTRELTLQFPCPPSEPVFLESPTGAILSLLRAEGNGSLLSLLKARGWVESISTQYWRGADDFQLLSVDFELTEEGVEHHQSVIEYFFQYVQLMAASDLRQYFDERTQQAQIDFQHIEADPPLRTVDFASLLLQYYPTKHVVDFNAVYGGYNEELLQLYLSKLTPSNMQAVLLAPNVETDSVEPIYNTAYSVRALDADLMKQWTESTVDPALSLPEPNRYIATNAILKPAEYSETPVLVRDELGLQVWHLHDASFNVPHANIRLSLHSPLATKDLHNRVCNRLYAAVLRESIREFSYPIEQAGMSVELSSSWKGIQLELSGYDEKQKDVLMDLSQHIRELALDEESFARAKARLIREWRDFEHMEPLGQGSQVGFRLLNPTYDGQYAAADALEKVGLDDFQNFIAQWFEEVSVQLLIHGNHNREDALRLVEVIDQHYREGATAVEWPSRSMRRIPAEELVQDIALNHPDSVLVAVYQGGESTVDLQARYKLMSDLIRADFFTEIRTKQQLGYQVNAFYTQADRVPGFRMIIQSASVGPAVLQERVDAFLVAQRERIRLMSDEAFEAFKLGVIAEEEQRDPTLSRRTDWLERDLRLGYTGFDHRKQLVAALRPLTRDETLALYDSVFFGEERGRILVRGTGTAHADEAPSDPCFGDDCVLPRLVERVQ